MDKNRIKIMLDYKPFFSKPPDKDIEYTEIHGRFKKAEIAISELQDHILQGKSFKQGQLKGTKNEDFENQILIALDFDNKLDEPEKRTTVEAELARCRELGLFPIFGYYSLSNAEHLRKYGLNKFRLVFCLNKPIENLVLRNTVQDRIIALFPNCDISTSDATRVFFGGPVLIEDHIFNKANRINIETILNLAPKEIIKAKRELIPIPKENYDDLSMDSQFKISAISTMNTTAMQTLLEITEATPEKLCKTRQEIYDALNDFDLHKFLGVPKGNFNCVLREHQDNNPSANIYFTSGGFQKYKCFSCGARHDIITLTQYFAKTHIPKAMDWLQKVLKIRLVQSDRQLEYLDILKTYRELLQSSRLKELYPEPYAMIRTRINDLIAMFSFAETVIHCDDLIFHSSQNILMQEFGTNNPNRVSSSINLFALLGIILKLPPNKVPKDMRRKAQQIAMDLGGDGKLTRKLTNFFQIPPNTPEQMALITENAKTLKGNNFSKAGLSREYVLRTFGKEKADEIYPQYLSNNKHFLEDIEEKASDKKTMELIQLIGTTIDRQGFILEKDVFNTFITKSGFGNEDKEMREVKSRKQWKRSIQDILNTYNNWILVTANQELKKKYKMKLPARSYPKIIIKKDDLG